METRARGWGEERDGFGGAEESLKAPWQRWPAVVVEEDEPLHFFGNQLQPIVIDYNHAE